MIKPIVHTVRPSHRGMIAFALLLLLACFSGVTSPARAADFQTWTTENGMRVLFAPAPALPMLDIRLVFDAGSARDGRHGGLARLTNTALTFGTQDMDADTVAERFESVGARFGTSVARDMATVHLRTLTEADWMETALETLLALLHSPAFPEEDLARVRRQTLQALQREGQEPGTIAFRRFYQLAYGEHPYANHPLGTVESVPDLDGSLVRDFFQGHYTAQNAVLALTGDLSIAAARALSQRIAAALPSGASPPALAAPEIPSEPILEHIPFASEQAHIIMGHPLLARNDPDRFPLTVANHVFGGGGFTSRLFQEVRTERGLAYAVSSHIQPMAAEGPFMITMQTGVDQAGEALEVLRKALDAFIREGVTEEELRASQDNIIGRFPLGLVSNNDIAATLAMIGFYDLAPDYLTTYINRIAQVSREEAGNALARRLQADRMVTVVVGGPADLLDELRTGIWDDPEGS